MSGSHVLFGSKIVSRSSAETFGNLLSRVQEEKFADRRVDKVNIDNGKIFLVLHYFFFACHPGQICD